MHRQFPVLGLVLLLAASCTAFDTKYADRVAEGHVCEIGIPWHFPSNRIDWLFNPTKAKPPYNPEWTWQLNRLGGWKVLADAYAATKDEKYARAFAVQLADWLDQTGAVPPEKGYNGRESPWRTIEEGLRLMGPQPVAYRVFARSPSVPAALRARFLECMRAQARHLMAHRTAKGNWLLMEMNGVYTFACRFPDLPESAELRKASSAILAAAIREQVLSDGLHYELSPDYHLVFYICAAQMYELARECGFAHELPSDYAGILERGADGYVKMMAPGFVQPRFNDCYTMETKRVLERAARFFPHRRDFLWAATEGRAGEPPASTPTASRYLPYSGFAVMRSGWTRDASYLAFDVGPLGMGHWHQDKLSFTLWKGDEELVFDDGGGQYEVSDFRTYALSGYDHNTLLVDGLAQFRRDPKIVDGPIDADWTTTPARDSARGVYDQGFGPKQLKLARHTREIAFEKPQDLFRVTDTATSADGDAHVYELLFHVDTTNVVVAADGRSLVARFGKKWDLALTVEQGGAISLQSGAEKPRLAGWFVGRNNLDVHKATTITVTAPRAKDATFVTTFRPVEAMRPSPQMGVLTPPVGPAPRINGPRVFGVRPGHPVLWRIPVTGARPLEVAVEGLPAGVGYDAALGMVTGAVASVGSHDLVVTAKNAKGTATRRLSLKAGDAICLTPPLGWNSWNCWGQEVSDEKMRRAADAMVASGLAEHGWSYIVVDDCWRTRPTELQAGFKRPGWIADKPHMPGPARKADGTPETNAWFPDMKAMADYIHAKGLRAGLYSVPSEVACCYTWGSWKHEAEDARTWASWGYDLVKYDWCYGQRHFDGKGTDRDWQVKLFTLMGRELAKQPRDLVYNVCQYGRLDVTTWAKGTGAHYWRTNDDLKDTWPLLLRSIDENLKVADAAGPDGWNDPDMLVVGPMRSNGFTKSRLTPNEQYTHLSLWAIMAAPLFIGCDLERLPNDPLALSLLTNDEVLDIDQDELGKVGRPVVHTPQYDVWARPLANGDWAVALFNRTWEPLKIAVPFKALGISGEHVVRDVWAQRDLGTSADAFSEEVYGHATRLFRLRRANH